MGLTVDVIGCGEALDPDLANASVVVASADYRILVDCGHSVPRPLVAAFPEPGAIDAVVFTHLHPDHCFGLAPMLIEWTDGKRGKPLTIVTSREGREFLTTLCALGSTAIGRLPYPVLWRTYEEAARLGPFAAAFAPTRHSLPNQALRLSAGGRTFAYSGDGRPTPEGVALFGGANLLMQECYGFDAEAAGQWHCDLAAARAVAADAGVGRMLLYHLRRDQRPRFAAEAGIELAREGARYEL